MKPVPNPVLPAAWDAPFAGQQANTNTLFFSDKEIEHQRLLGEGNYGVVWSILLHGTMPAVAKYAKVSQSGKNSPLVH